MTNNPTIDGVSREDLDLVLTYGCGTDASDAAWHRLRTLLDAPDICPTCDSRGGCPDCKPEPEPAVERQEPGDVFIDPLKACDVCGDKCTAALQSTIAQLQARIAELKDGIDKHWKVVCDQRSRIAELESGRGEPSEYRYRFTHRGETSKWFPVDSYNKLSAIGNDPAYEIQPLYTSPPAPVAVVLPDRKSFSPPSYRDGHAEGWNACLDATAALNGVKP